MNGRLVRALGAMVVTAALTLSGAAVAQADPAPNSGAARGGASVHLVAPEASRFSQISAGPLHTLARGLDGEVYAWGANGSGALGDGTTIDRSTPVQVRRPEGVTFTRVSAGLERSFALTDTGDIYAWGHFGHVLGTGQPSQRELVPVPVVRPAGVTFTGVASAESHALATSSSGRVYAWGENADGRLGDGTRIARSTPVEVALPTGVSFFGLAAGQRYSLAIGSDGKTYAWGDNRDAVLGNGTTTDSIVPTPVTLPGGRPFTALSAGYAHVLAIGSDGRAYAWGAGGYGRLGTGDTTARLVPTPVAMPDDATVIQVSAGEDHSFALTASGMAYGWGHNDPGRLGDGTQTNRLTPAPIAIPGGRALQQIGAGKFGGQALASDGSAYSWGGNGSGQLGDGAVLDEDTDPAPRLSPGPVASTAVITAVRFGGIAGRSLTVGIDGSARVLAPAHAAGRVAVSVSWLRGGVPQPARSYGEFTYVGSFAAAPKPRISGTARVGKKLKVRVGSWAPGTVKLRYRWLRNGTAIRGAAAAKAMYRLTKRDAGKRISVRVTGSKAYYVTATKVSAAKRVRR